jgi:CRP-like cAMP-binding protein
VDWAAFLAGISRGKTILEYGANGTIFAQGDPPDSVSYLKQGEAKLAVTSDQGKEAIVSVLGEDELFGESCLAGQPLRISTVIAVTDCAFYRIEKTLMLRMLHQQLEVSELFITHLLSRNTRYEEDLVDQLFSSSEKRLARILLLLEHYHKECGIETVHPGINQEHLVQMEGTTRSRVSHFMNRFRTMGFIDYAGNGALTVNSGLLSVILRDQKQNQPPTIWSSPLLPINLVFNFEQTRCRDLFNLAPFRSSLETGGNCHLRHTANPWRRDFQNDIMKRRSG